MTVSIVDDLIFIWAEESFILWGFVKDDINQILAVQFFIVKISLTVSRVINRYFAQSD